MLVDPWFVARAVGFGSLIGLSLGALGAGGSILTVPILVYAMGVPVQGATGTQAAGATKKRPRPSGPRAAAAEVPA